MISNVDRDIELQLTQAVANRKIEQAIKIILKLLVKEEDLHKYTWTGRKRSIDKDSIPFTAETENCRLMTGT